ncbi:MAG TPA: ROK family protein, partial [Candidatus Caenarcaniphilales bacterium]|nr:ROK family protein [Candidatus Caenarcaniphilales bacterium]
VRGHLEAFSSGTGIAARARDALAEAAVEPGSPLALLAAEQGAAALEAGDVAQAEERGDDVAARIMEEARLAFAEAMVCVVNLFNPALVIVGGGICLGQGDRLLDPARALVRQNAFRVQAARVQIVQAALGDDVGLVGALPLVADRLPRPPTTGEAADLKPRAMAAARLALPLDAAGGDDSDGTTEQPAAPVVR